MSIKILNKKLERYLNEFFGIRVASLGNYVGRWFFENNVFIPHIANDSYEDYFFVDEKVVKVDQDLEDGKFYFLDDFEGIFLLDREKTNLALVRISSELSYVRYFILIKHEKVYGVIVNYDDFNSWFFDIARSILYAQKAKESFRNKTKVGEFKQKVLHILKMSYLDVDDDLFYRIDSMFLKK